MDNGQDRCVRCTHFTNDARTLEKMIPGLISLGSADGSARGDDGYCAHHERLTGARGGCGAFAVRTLS